MGFAVSLVEQGLGSIITFGINLWMIRTGAATSYGVYVFWFSLAWMLGTAQGTLVITHLFNLPADATQRRDPERLLLSVTLLLLLVAAVVVAATVLFLWLAHSALAEPAAIFFIPAFLFYQYARALAFARRRVGLAAALTGLVLLGCIAGLGIDHLVGEPADAARVLIRVGAAYGLAAVAVLLLLLRGIRPMFRPAELRPYTRYLRGSGWMMLGAAAGEAISRLYSFVVVGRFGPEALARLSAVQVAIRPAWLLSSAWSSVGFPAMAAQRAVNDRRGLILTMVRGAVATGAGSLVWSGAVIVLWPQIAGTLYRGRYVDAVGIAWLWAANVILGSIATALNVATLALGEFRRLALLDVVAASLCAAAMLLLGRFDYPFAIIATMLGQVTQIVLMCGVLGGRLRSPGPIAAVS